jgi:hypothetical protein
MVVADPVDACSPLGNPSIAGLIVLALRGKCSFYDKAMAVLAAGGAALVIAQDRPGVPYTPQPINPVDYMPAQINLPMSMIYQVGVHVGTTPPITYVMAWKLHYLAVRKCISNNSIGALKGRSQRAGWSA